MSCNSSWVVCITYQRRFNSSKMYLANKHFEEERNNSKCSISVGTNEADFSLSSTFFGKLAYIILRRAARVLPEDILYATSVGRNLQLLN